MSRRTSLPVTLVALSAAALVLGLSPSPGLAQVPAQRLQSALERIMGPRDTSISPNPRPLTIVWVYSRPAEGSDSHDFEAQMKIWKPLFQTLPKVAFTAVLDWPSPSEWQAADLVVFNFRFGLRKSLAESQYADLDAYLARGKGLVPIHVGVALQDGFPKRYAQYIGLSWQWADTGVRDSKDRAGATVYSTRREHPLVGNLPDTLHITEETYFNLYGDTAQIQVLNTSLENTAAPGAPEKKEAVPVMWTKLTGPGRVFASVAGHYTATHDDAYFRLLLLRGMAWAAGEKFDRFRTLVTLNANVKNDVLSIVPKHRDSRSFPYTGRGYRLTGRMLPE